MAREYISAFTNPGCDFPSYINFSQDGPDTVVITMRGDATPVNGFHICGHIKDKGKPGRCTPGDRNCNNYCNLAPEKGNMQDSPSQCSYYRCGETQQMTMSVDNFKTFIAEMAKDKAKG